MDFKKHFYFYLKIKIGDKRQGLRGYFDLMVKSGGQKKHPCGKKVGFVFNFGQKYSLSSTTVGQEMFPAWMDFKKQFYLCLKIKAMQETKRG